MDAQKSQQPNPISSIGPDSPLPDWLKDTDNSRGDIEKSSPLYDESTPPELTQPLTNKNEEIYDTGTPTLETPIDKISDMSTIDVTDVDEETPIIKPKVGDNDFPEPVGPDADLQHQLYDREEERVLKELEKNIKTIV